MYSDWLRGPGSGPGKGKISLSWQRKTFQWGWSGRAVKLTTHLDLVTRSRISGFIRLLHHRISWRSTELVKYFSTKALCDFRSCNVPTNLFQYEKTLIINVGNCQPWRVDRAKRKQYYSLVIQIKCYYTYSWAISCVRKWSIVGYTIFNRRSQKIFIAFSEVLASPGLK